MEIKTIYWKNQHCKFVTAVLEDGNTYFMCLDEKDNVVLIDPREVEGINL